MVQPRALTVLRLVGRSSRPNCLDQVPKMVQPRALTVLRLVGRCKGRYEGVGLSRGGCVCLHFLQAFVTRSQLKRPRICVGPEGQLLGRLLDHHRIPFPYGILTSGLGLLVGLELGILSSQALLPPESQFNWAQIVYHSKVYSTVF
jgi:hypothetical protein